MTLETFLKLIDYHYSGDTDKFNEYLTRAAREFYEEGNVEISNKIQERVNKNSPVVLQGSKEGGK